jgi:hypothetical protein
MLIGAASGSQQEGKRQDTHCINVEVLPIPSSGLLTFLENFSTALLTPDGHWI